MKKWWHIIIGVLTLGLAYSGGNLVIKSHQKETEDNTESDKGPGVLFFFVIGIILLLAFSVEIRDTFIPFF